MVYENFLNTNSIGGLIAYIDVVSRALENCTIIISNMYFCLGFVGDQWVRWVPFSYYMATFIGCYYIKNQNRQKPLSNQKLRQLMLYQSMWFSKKSILS
jgi:hypothetical protein